MMSYSIGAEAVNRNAETEKNKEYDKCSATKMKRARERDSNGTKSNPERMQNVFSYFMCIQVHIYGSQLICETPIYVIFEEYFILKK